jgi:hypothetical protein
MLVMGVATRIPDVSVVLLSPVLRQHLVRLGLVLLQTGQQTFVRQVQQTWTLPVVEPPTADA